jgi:HK97 gp10 family phage protein
MPNNLAAIGLRIKEAAVAGLNQGADLTAMRAKGHAPVRSGKLQSEIEAVHATGEGSQFEAQVISPTPYAVYQEFGTAHHKPHPYLRPALHESHEQVTELIRSEVRTAIKGSKAKVVVKL